MNIRSYAQMVLVLEMMKTNLPTYAAVLGTTAADVTFVAGSYDNALYILDYAEMMDGSKKAYTGIKQRFYNGDGGAIPDGPPIAVFNPPFPMKGDTHGELMKLIGRIKSSNGYNGDPIGKALGIAGDAPTPPDPGTLKPTLDADAGQSGLLYAVVVGNRSGYDMWELEVQTMGSMTWTNVGRFDGKSQDLVYAGGGNAPIQIRLRVRLWKAGSSVGLYSKEVVITVNP